MKTRLPSPSLSPPSTMRPCHAVKPARGKEHASSKLRFVGLRASSDASTQANSASAPRPEDRLFKGRSA